MRISFKPQEATANVHSAARPRRATAPPNDPPARGVDTLAAKGATQRPTMSESLTNYLQKPAFFPNTRAKLGLKVRDTKMQRLEVKAGKQQQSLNTVNPKINERAKKIIYSLDKPLQDTGTLRTGTVLGARFASPSVYDHLAKGKALPEPSKQTFEQNAIDGFMHGHIDSQAQKLQMTPKEYLNPKATTILSALPVGTKMMKTAVPAGADMLKAQRLENSQSKLLDKLQEYKTQQAMETDRNMTISGGKKYYDAHSSFDAAKRAESSHTADALAAAEKLKPKPAAFWTLGFEPKVPTPIGETTASTKKSAAELMQLRNQRAETLAQQLPAQDQAAMDALKLRNQAQRGMLADLTPTTLASAFYHAPSLLQGQGTGSFVRGVSQDLGHAADPAALSKSLPLQRDLEQKATTAYATNKELFALRKQQTEERLGNAQARGGDVFYDAPQTSAEQAQRDLQASRAANSAMPQHQMFNNDPGNGVSPQLSDVNLIPSTFLDGARRMWY